MNRSVDKTNPAYPIRLAQVADAPDELYMLGSALERSFVVAIVGARAASGRGTTLACRLASTITDAGGLVISGGALGIDAAAHRGALATGGSTVAVLPSGLDRLHPARNRDLFADILAQRGALVSPYKDGTPPRKFHFVRRNRIIAAMADAVVVVEASFASGALYTAQAARSYQRTVCAVPGSPGCESLIAQGAAVAECEADVLDALAGNPRKPNVELPNSGSDEAIVLRALGKSPVNEESLADVTGLTTRLVLRALISLELEGLALPLPGRIYVRSTLADELVREAFSG